MITRRGIFQLIAGAAVMVAVPAKLRADDLPRIYGEPFWNGLPVCDADGFEALVRGDAVEMSRVAAEAVTRADRFYDFGHMTLHIRRPLVFDNLVGTTMQNMQIEVRGDLPFYFRFTETANYNTLQNVQVRMIE